MEKIPERSADLIAELAKEYKPKHPSLTDPERKIWWDAGQADLVEMLLEQWARQNKKARPRRAEADEEQEQEDTQGDDDV